MKFRSLNIALIGAVLAVSCLVNITYAGIITEKWSATVTKVHNTTAYSQGDLLQFIFSYDSTSTESHTYDKGLDGVTGTIDDILTYSQNILDQPNYDIFSDITTNFLDLATTMINETMTQGFEVHDWSGYYNTYSHTPYGIAWSDEEITVSSSNGISSAYAFFTPAFSNGDVRTSYVDNGVIISKYIELSSFTRTVVQQVPEPSTLAVFALSMIGLASRRFKNNLSIKADC
jgi:hypothetical protein